MRLSHKQRGCTLKRLLAGEGGAVRPIVIVLVAALIACIGVGVAGGRYLINTYTQIQDVENEHDIVPELPDDADAEDQKNDDSQQAGKIDFEALAEENPDIYAWIYIPNTHVNYPVCQNPESNDYYLSHSASGSESEVGAIYSEAQFNHADLNDRVTVLYGHNGYADSMFSDLHEYERSEYFDEHDKIYLYAPDGVRTYQVFSAFSAGERHVMDAFDLQSEEGMEAFVTYLMNPEAIDAQVRDMGVSTDDQFLILSTCSTGVLESQGRYLVCGVLVDERSA